MILKKIQIIFFFLFVAGFISQASGEPIDLTKEDLYLRQGFKKSWLEKLPAGKEWKKIAAVKTEKPSVLGRRSVRVKEQNLEGLPKRTFLSPYGAKPMEFTFVTSFTIDKSRRYDSRVPGLYIKRIAFNWEIYVNGRLIKREIHLDEKGDIERLCSYRDVMVEMNPLYLKEGKNILAFRIIGDPTHVNTGLLSGGPYLIGTWHELDEYRSETVILVLVFIYLFVGFYHLLLYYNRRYEQYNLYFGIMVIVISVYFFSRTHSVYALLPDTGYVIRMEFISLFLLLPAALFFFEKIIRTSISLFSKITLGVYGLFIASLFPSPLSFSEDILRVWQLTAAVPLGYIVWITGRDFLQSVNEYIQLNNFTGNRFLLLLRMMRKTVSGNLLLGVVILFFTGIFDIVDAAVFNMDIVLSRYFFFIVIIGMTVMLANRFIYIHNEIAVLNRNLEEKVEDLNQANMQISHSEEKYRVLVEGANDIIFSLDADLKFITANNALHEQLKINNQKIEGLEFYQLIYDEVNEVGINSDFVRKKVEEFQRKRKPVKFKTELISRHLKEPVAMQVKLQYIDNNGKDEIIGRASRETEDSLLKYFVSEKQKLRIENYLVTADEVSRRMTRNLPKFCSMRDADLLRLALREMIVNAIEHGNLEVTFEEKSKSMIEGKYLELIESRQRQPEYRNRKITIEYLISSKKVIYLIVDQGAGFDFARMIEQGAEKANEEMLAHGRGIMMAKNIFDKVEFLGKGNQVKLVKNFSPEE